MADVRIKIEGMASSMVCNKFGSFFIMKENEIVLLCTFSEFDIPICHVFTIIEDNNGNECFVGPITLVKVSQGFGLPFDMIPQGHKTICKFSFNNSEVPEVVKRLPVVNNWHESKDFIIFK